MIRLTPTALSLTEQMQQVRDIAQVATVEHRQELQVHVQNLVLDWVMVDGGRLRQVLLNLLSNAVKYTPDGGKIEMRLEEIPCMRREHAQFCFMVIDNGHGITPELQKRIFEPFARGEASVTNKVQGSGLGMAITKNIINRMDGKITLESEVGKGSCFAVTLILPIAAKEEKTVSTQVQGALAGKRFLCAEDNAINAEILGEILKLHGAQYKIYPDGAQLLQAFKDAAPGDWDAILMDVQMPNMNGLEAARAIRGGENPVGWTIPIIAMTANAFMENVRQSMEAGMNAYISKPISGDVLEETVKELCNPVETSKNEEEEA